MHVQSDPAGRLVISGHPEQLDNPWGVTPFKKVSQGPQGFNRLNSLAKLHKSNDLVIICWADSLKFQSDNNCMFSRKNKQYILFIFEVMVLILMDIAKSLL